LRNDHLTLETLADWLSGRLEHDEVVTRIVPHLLARCPTCRRLHERVLALQEETGHWDESVAVHEGLAAPGLLAELLAVPPDERWPRLEEDSRFHLWGLCELMIRRSAAAIFDDPPAAVDLAEAAVRLCRHLPREAYHPDWVEDLTARAWATFGNGQRVLGELRGADAAFRNALEHLAASRSGNWEVEAEVYDLWASLRRAERRLPEALEILEHSLALYREVGDAHRIGRALLSKAKILEEAGDLETAIDLLEEAPALLDSEREPHLLLALQHNRLWLLTLTGREKEAEALLPELLARNRELGGKIDRIRLRWLEAAIARGLGYLEAAEEAFVEVRDAFYAQGMSFDAALAALELATIYAARGRTAELREIAARLVAIFESRDLPREAWAALLLFRQACEEERATAELARHLGTLLRNHRPPRGAKRS
jgi:tetratricopeptide (TPR) repeat protein